jgi:hypothetical protein
MDKSGLQQYPLEGQCCMKILDVMLRLARVKSTSNMTKLIDKIVYIDLIAA